MTAAIYDNDHFNQPKPYVDTVTLDLMELIEHSRKMEELNRKMARGIAGEIYGAKVMTMRKPKICHAMCICATCWFFKNSQHSGQGAAVRTFDPVPEPGTFKAAWQKEGHPMPLPKEGLLIPAPKGKNGNPKVFYHNEWREVDIDKWGYCTFYLPEADTDYGHIKWTHLDDRKDVE